MSIGCSRCGGSDPECEKCAGTDNVPVYQCPSSTAEGMGVGHALSRAMEAYSYMERCGVLPGPGSLDDQAGAFVAFCRTVDSERARIRKIEKEKAKIRRDIEEAARGA